MNTRKKTLYILGLFVLVVLALYGAGTSVNGSRTLQSTLNFCADAGSTDAYACNMSPALIGYVSGSCYTFKANTANTGAATIAFNGLSAITIVKVSGGITTTLANNDILVGQYVNICYDGTNMQIQSTLGNAATGVVTSVNGATGAVTLSLGTVYCADATGSTTTYTCTPSPAVASYTTGMKVTFVPQAANTAGSTVNISGLGAKSIIAANTTGSALVADDLLAAGVYTLEYDGTNFRNINGPDGAWTALAYANSWTDFGSSYQVGQSRKRRDGTVEVRCVCKNGTTTAGTTAFTLAVGYRPPTKTAVGGLGAPAAGSALIPSQLDIMTNGTVVQQSLGTLFAATSAWFINFTFSVY